MKLAHRPRNRPKVTEGAKSYASRFGIGFTDAEGKYQVHASNGDGLETGEYKVTFSRQMDRSGKGPIDPSKKPDEAGARETLPPELTDQAKTQHSATVTETSHEFDFDLKSK